jgi:hypothetical protein
MSAAAQPRPASGYGYTSGYGYKGPGQRAGAIAAGPIRHGR